MFVKKTSRFIEISTGRYPLTVDDVQRTVPKYLFGEYIDNELLQAIGFSAVLEQDKPTDDLYVESVPVWENGVYKQTWAKVTKTPELLKAQLNSAKEQLRDKLRAKLAEVLNSGFAYTFECPTGGYVEHVQARDQDLSMLQLVLLMEEKRPGPSLYVRTYENHRLTVTIESLSDIITMATAFNCRMKDLYWDLCLRVDCADTIEELPEIPAVWV